ncbi:MAG: hypothetical protein LC790_18225 [Actinobacteria bacterium]|nr:hypothetical protein [Actinomycetota bacterium]
MFPESATALAERSTEVRQANKRERHALAEGRVTIADVMRDQPTELSDRALFEILLLARGVGRKRLHEPQHARDRGRREPRPNPRQRRRIDASMGRSERAAQYTARCVGPTDALASIRQ